MINLRLFFFIFLFFISFSQNLNQNFDKRNHQKSNTVFFLKKEFPQFNFFKDLKFYYTVVQKKIPIQKPNFCQGLFYHKKYLYYSSGLYGKSVVKKINLKNNRTSEIFFHQKNIFGEGITVVNDFLWQLSWREKTAFVFETKTLTPIKQIRYSGEGWGLTHDDKYLIISDGSEYLFYRNRKTFDLIKKQKVFFQNKKQKIAINYINALQNVAGKIFANIWYKKVILIIDKKKGKVIGAVDCRQLFLEEKKSGEKSRNDNVLNGIAHREKKLFYLTGKNWDNIYLVKLKKYD